MSTQSILHAAWLLKQGGIIAYPTEAVFGLGCDPFNQDAVMQLLRLKRRSAQKGLILIADCFEKLQPLVENIPSEKREAVLATWPGPYTWVFPANLSMVPEEITGGNKTVAVRVTAHPIARQLCQVFGRALVSTSANFSLEEPLCTEEAVRAYFGDDIDYILRGETSGLLNPTQIRDALTGEILRC